MIKVLGLKQLIYSISWIGEERKRLLEPKDELFLTLACLIIISIRVHIP